MAQEIKISKNDERGYSIIYTQMIETGEHGDSIY